MFKKSSIGLLISAISPLVLGVDFSEDKYVKLAAKSGCLYKQGKGADVKAYERGMADFAKGIGVLEFNINKFKSDQVAYSSDKDFMNRRLGEMMELMNSCNLLVLNKEKLENDFLGVPIIETSVVTNKVIGKDGMPSVMELEIKKDMKDIVSFYESQLSEYEPKKIEAGDTIIYQLSFKSKKRIVTLEPGFMATKITILGE